jgi:hypothetical protein
MLKHTIATIGHNQFEMVIPVHTAIGEVSFSIPLLQHSNKAVIMVTADKYQEACINGDEHEFHDCIVKQQPMSSMRQDKYDKFSHFVKGVTTGITPPYVHSYFCHEKMPFPLSLFSKTDCLRFGLQFTNGISRSFWLIQNAPKFPIMCDRDEVVSLAKLLAPIGSCDWEIIADVYQKHTGIPNVG